ncbi:mRNA turnover protein 4 homolog [Euwallacea fornicatus]|uniref:mRNA turnover protein 4 homolog n=1 Tax=Euwallacea fornicatus TaxID=995702 RepID=UPI00338FB40C
MPKSKRDKKISLTKTDKKGLALKQKIVDDIRNCVQKYQSIYLFTFKNMRNEKMKEVREQWKPSRFFFGKNKVISIGLGRTEEEEVEEGLHKLSACMKGQCALLFTNSTQQEVTEWFDDYSVEDFARSGFKSTQTVILNEGPLKQFSHAIEPYLRQLGMPTKLDRGVVTLIKDFEVCKEGSILTPEQAKILELLEHRLATFKLILLARWSKEGGFEKIASHQEDEDMNEEDGD